MAAAAIWLAIGSFAYLQYWPVEDCVDWGTTAQAEPEIVRPGTLFFVKREITVRADAFVHFDRRLQQVNCHRCRLYTLDRSSRYYKASDNVVEMNRGTMVPDGVLPGRYEYIVTGTWSVNLLREKTIQLPVVQIEVIP